MKTFKFETVPQFISRGGVIKKLKPIYSTAPCSIKKLKDTAFRKRRLSRLLLQPILKLAA